MHRNTFAFIAVIVAALLAVGCGVPQDKYDADIAALQKELDASTVKANTLQKDLDGMRRDKEALDAELAGLKKALQSITGERDALAKAKALANQRLETFRHMLAKFKAMIDSGKIKIKIRNNRMIVEMESAILFASGKAKLSRDGKDALTEVAEILKTIEGRKFQVAGHTDNVPVRSRKFKDNWNLSSARAVAVVRHVVTSGMDPNNLSSAGYADTQPVGDNKTEEGRALNRRIEIVLMPNLDELPNLSQLEEML